MKTPEEWMNQLSGLNNPNLITVNRMAIQEIQLDAMKEGMRRASKLAPTDEQMATNHGDVSEQRIGVIDFKDRILTAAEQLTKKDLMQ